MWKQTAIGAIGAAALFMGALAPASAQTAQPPAGEAYWQTVQYRNWDGYYDNGRDGYYGTAYNGYYGDGYYGDRYYGGYYGGPIEGAFGFAGDVVRGAGEVVGGTVGAVGSAVAGPYAYRDDSACAARYRSYDPASGTYLGFDGRRHPCPY